MDNDAKIMMKSRSEGLAWPFVFAVLLHVLFPLAAFILVNIFPAHVMPEIAGSDAPIQAFMVNKYKSPVPQEIPEDIKRIKELEKAAKKIMEDQQAQQALKDQEEILRKKKIEENKLIKEAKIIEQEIKKNEAKEAKLRDAELKRQQQEEIKQEQERLRKEAIAAERKKNAEDKRKRNEEAKIKTAMSAINENEMSQELDLIRGAKTNALNSERDRYYAAIKSAIERNWIAPSGIQTGAKCDISLKQTKGGVIVNYNIGNCSAAADAGFKNSVQDAVARTSKLPPAPHPDVWREEFKFEFVKRQN